MIFVEGCGRLQQHGALASEGKVLLQEDLTNLLCVVSVPTAEGGCSVLSLFLDKSRALFLRASECSALRAAMLCSYCLHCR